MKKFVWESDAFDLSLFYLKRKIYSGKLSLGQKGEDFINYLQMKVQIMTLDPQIGVIKSHSTEDEFSNAVSYSISSEDFVYDTEL